MSTRAARRAESRAYRDLQHVAAILNRIPPTDPAWDTLNAMFLAACRLHDETLAACGICPYEFDPDPAPPAPAAALVALPLAA